MKPMLLFLAVPLLILYSCSKHNPAQPQPKTPILPSDFGKPYTLPGGPEANALYDNLNYGIYKGITINAQDSAATFSFHLDNDGHSIYTLEYMGGSLRDSLVRLVVDSSTHLAHQPPAQDTSSVNLGADFYGVFESFDYLYYGNALVLFSAKGDGTSPYLGVTLNDNNSQSAVLKEKSGKQVFCFEGTYVSGYPVASVGPDSGRISLVLSADTVIATCLSEKGLGGFSPSGGQVANGNFTIKALDISDDYILITGVVTGNTCSGTWLRQPSGATGQFSAKRTL
jgi:hypothetical protein